MPGYDLILRDGMIVDGSGETPYRGDVAIQEERIVAVGDLGDASAAREIQLDGLTIAPGFINMMCHANESLIEDGRSQSDIRQGVTLEIMGEGASMGPLNDELKQQRTHGLLGNPDIHYDIEWTTLDEYLVWLAERGVSPNIASFVGTGTLRSYAVGYDDREPTADELQLMRDLTEQAMKEGAVGLSTALIYPPASYAKTDEIIELVKIVAKYNGLYASHIRSEGDHFHEALEEFFEIVEKTGVRGEIYHLKSSGAHNWFKLDGAIEMIEDAQKRGLEITADVYTYPASGTTLNTILPAWVHEGGLPAMLNRLQDPTTRAMIKGELQSADHAARDMWSNVQTPDRVLLAGFKTDELKPLTGKTVAEVAEMRGTSPEDTVMDLLVEDGGQIFAIYFTMNEDNVRKKVALPWVSFCSDAASLAPEGVFTRINPHPRAYGSFARVFSIYVREGVLSVEQAVRKLATLPARALRLKDRGALIPGYYADVVVFDPAQIQDHATFENPHQYATGMQHVFVNGVQVLENGDHTGAKPGQVVRGPGYNGS